MDQRDHSKRLAQLSPADRLALFEELKRKKEVRQSTAGIPRMQRANEAGPFPLSFAQQRLWFLEQLEPGTALYNMAESWIIQGALHYGALQRAFDALVSRHEILRTTFIAIDGEPAQVIAPPQ